MSIRLKLGAAIVALLLLGGSVALGIWMTRDGIVAHIDKDADRVAADADAVPADLVRQDAPIYYEFDPPIIVNLKDSDAILQAGIALSTHYASLVDALKNDDPALRSAILFALADAQVDAATSDDTKRLLLTKISNAVNRQLQQDGYRGSVDAAYFTSFIVQDIGG